MAGDRRHNASAPVGGLDLVALRMNGTLVDGVEGSPDLAHMNGGTTDLGATSPNADGDGSLVRVVSLGGNIGRRVLIQSSVGLLI
jgi:hypothetical protein